MDVLQDLKILLQPVDTLRILSMKRRVFKRVAKLNVTCSESKEPVPYEEREKGQKPVRRGHVWGGIFDCAWFHVTGEIPEKLRGEKLCVIFDVLGEGLAVGEGKGALQGFSHLFGIGGVAEFFNPPMGKSVFRMNADADKVDLWIDAGFNGLFGKEIFRGKFLHADLAVADEKLYDYYFDYLAAAFLKVVAKGKDKLAISSALGKSYFEYTCGNYDKASRRLRAVLEKPSESDLTVTAVGHSHLDLAWLWPMRETERKAARTVSNAIRNTERYPEYVYGASQPQEFVWLKEQYPALYERVKKAFAKGNFEPQGGMWVECDTNISGGEALIRQFVYGLDFWEKEFGVSVNNCWLPDVFGYTAALPQIIKGCGMDYFMTQKISWNEHNDFPLQTFLWQGLSDDEVLVHLLPANTYNSSGAAPSLAELYRNHKKKDKVSDEALMLFGAGDGGGGACEANIELIKRYRNTRGLPKINFGKACDFFDRLNEKREQYPVYKGELYLEKHQGTYTTQSNNKKYNRTCEYALHTLEALGALAARKGYKYPYDDVAKIWKEVLLYQFHDILPGSSINRVYKETTERYKAMLADLEKLTADVIDFLAQSAEKENAIDGVAADGSETRGNAVYFNPAPFARKEYINIGGKATLYEAAAYSFGEAKPVASTPQGLKTSQDSIENEFLKVVFSKDGAIKSVFDKTSKHEFNGAYINRLNVYYDKKLPYNAWDIDINYTKKRPSHFKAVSSRSYIDGASAVVETEYRYGKSSLVQKSVLTAGKPYVEFDTSVDWHETHRMLRAEFMPSFFADKVTCDIQFGNISRSTKTDNKIDWAQFEICAHKYVDVSNDGKGCALLSDSKYGFRVKDGLLSINLLRSPVYPDKTADRGKHRFRYAFYPHTGDCFSAKVPEQSYLFNLLPVETKCKKATSVSPVSLSAGNLVAETIKPSEDGKATVIRVYENEGKACTATVSLGFGYDKIYECDMRENNAVECGAELSFRPYEIKTLYVI